MNDISQVCDIHIESSTQATAFDRPHKSDMRTADAPFFNRGMVGTVTTVITSDANSHGDISATKAPTKTSRHRTPVFSRLHKTKDGQPDASTDDTKRSHTQPNQFLEAESRIGRWSYALANSRTRDESPAKPAPAIPKMTKEEFDALPPIIQRKYFSTVERLRFAQGTETSSLASTDESVDTCSDKVQTQLVELISAPNSSQNLLAENTTLDKKQFRPVIKRRPVGAPAHKYIESRVSQIYANPEDKRKSLSQGHLPISSQRQSILLNVADEVAAEDQSVEPRSHNKHSLSTSSELTILRRSLNRSASVDHLGIRMIPQTGDYEWMDGQIKATEDSIYNSFRWLEDEDGLDLSLNVQDYHDAVERETAVKSPGPSFRRHLSISSKLNLRQSISLSRPGTMDTGSPSLFGSGSAMSVPGSPNHSHARRRSRALSLMSLSPTKQFTQETPQSPSLNEPVNHYQDPETRLKLRAYLSSAHKFDEAVEFGFPSADKAPETDEPPKLLPIRIDSLPQSSFDGGSLNIMKTLPEDRRCSLYSDGATNSEPDSPRTPTDMSRPPLPHINTNAQEQARDTTPKASDAAGTPASAREMTLRMTLTRPDLRANEEQIYGWLKPKSAAGSTSTDEIVSPVTQKRDDSKESIEREFAAYDLENLLSGDHGPMRRFWNKVRRN